jgi:hypothetical protein
VAIESDIRRIESTIAEINRKLDTLLEDREKLVLMWLSEQSLKDFLSNEPDLYSTKDVKARYG